MACHWSKATCFCVSLTQGEVCPQQPICLMVCCMGSLLQHWMSLRTLSLARCQVGGALLPATGLLQEMSYTLFRHTAGYMFGLRHVCVSPCRQVHVGCYIILGSGEHTVCVDPLVLVGVGDSWGDVFIVGCSHMIFLAMPRLLEIVCQWW